MEFRVFNGHIEMDGQPVARLLDKVNEWEVKDELKNYDGSNAGCDCDFESVYDDAHKDAKRQIQKEIFDGLGNLIRKAIILPRQANFILEEFKIAERYDEGEETKPIIDDGYKQGVADTKKAISEKIKVMALYFDRWECYSGKYASSTGRESVDPDGLVEIVTDIEVKK